MNTPQLSWSLTVRTGPLTGQVFPIQPGTQTIGRRQDNHIVISSPDVSGRHAQITLQPEGCWIADLGSTNGTFVNDQRITASTWLQAGDTIQIGPSVALNVQSVPAAAPEAVPAPPVAAPPPAAAPARAVASPPAAAPAAAARPSGAPRPRQRAVPWLVAGVTGAFLCLVVAIAGAFLLLRTDTEPTATPGTTLTAMPTVTPLAAEYTDTPAPGSTPTDTPSFATPTPTPEFTPTPTPCLPDADFVTDVSVPDNTPFEPGERFTKVWRILSNGCAPWPAGTRWVFDSGDQLGAPDSVGVPDTALDSTADIAVEMQAPDTPGTYKGIWQMQGPDGTRFGVRATVVIVVPESTATPTPTPTPTTTATALTPTPTPTPTTTPTPTPTPLSGDASIYFMADRYTIREGECVTISWLVDNVNAVFYNDRPVTGAESRIECPTETTTYELIVEHRDGEFESRTLTITVEPAY